MCYEWMKRWHLQAEVVAVVAAAVALSHAAEALLSKDATSQVLMLR